MLDFLYFPCDCDSPLLFCGFREFTFDTYLKRNIMDFVITG